ncbi:hypothetical protein CU100_25045 [Phyllobacterium endophyticum]|uniref:Uncharacterized protein n=1 Tax=Phyllobacterium endophyticum TaxID=1149773 RepID=A0A2P7AKV2_9HYPH|nr:hypothetical protein CU100_25045 [Phyllobacterium endophyticum]
MGKTLRRRQNDGMGNSQEHFADAAQAGSACFAQSEVLQIFLPASMRGQSLFAGCHVKMDGRQIGHNGREMYDVQEDRT